MVTLVLQSTGSPTHIDLYMQWDSHQTISSKYSVIGTLHHRAKTICSGPELLQQEEDHFKWSLNKMQVLCMGHSQGAEWKLEKNMQQTWSANLLQRRQCHQKPPNGS